MGPYGLKAFDRSTGRTKALSILASAEAYQARKNQQFYSDPGPTINNMDPNMSM